MCFQNCRSRLQFDTARFRFANFKKRSAKRLAFCVFIKKRTFLAWKRGAKLTLNVSLLPYCFVITIKSLQVYIYRKSCNHLSKNKKERVVIGNETYNVYNSYGPFLFTPQTNNVVMAYVKVGWNFWNMRTRRI